MKGDKGDVFVVMYSESGKDVGLVTNRMLVILQAFLFHFMFYHMYDFNKKKL